MSLILVSIHIMIVSSTSVSPQRKLVGLEGGVALGNLLGRLLLLLLLLLAVASLLVLVDVLLTDWLDVALDD